VFNQSESTLSRQAPRLIPTGCMAPDSACNFFCVYVRASEWHQGNNGQGQQTSQLNGHILGLARTRLSAFAAVCRGVCFAVLLFRCREQQFDYNHIGATSDVVG
jgi:hypothetical protein